jgi:hypothetical protein
MDAITFALSTVFDLNTQGRSARIQNNADDIDRNCINGTVLRVAGKTCHVRGSLRASQIKIASIALSVL